MRNRVGYTAKLKQKSISQLGSSIIGQIIIAFFVIFALKWQVLNQPPVWDTAFSVFPAAITLSETDFNLLGLLKMPGYIEGGPNVHAYSIITIITAVMISLFGKTYILFPVLHIMHFLIAAIGLAYFYRFCLPIFDRKISFLITLTVLVYPVFLTQTGYLYLEIPAFTFSILCLSAFVKRNYGSTIIFAALATLVKESGIIVAATVAMAAFLEPTSFKQKVIRSLSFFALPALLVAASSITIYPQVISIKQDFGSFFDKIIYLTIILRAYDIKRFLFNTPDLLVMIVLFVSLIPFSFKIFLHSFTDASILKSNNPQSIAQRHVSLSALFLINFFGFYYIALPTLHSSPVVLIRYYVPAIPFLLLTIFWFWLEKLRVNKRALSALLILSFVFFCLNRYGSFYPDEVDTFGNDFSIAERSAAYIDLLTVQQASIRFIEKLAKNHPVFYGLPIHYLTKYPAMAYSSAPLMRGYCIILDDRYVEAKLENFPRCFYMLMISPWLGGKIMQDLFSSALSNPDYSAVRVKSFSKGNYSAEILRINRRDEPCALPDELLLHP